MTTENTNDTPDDVAAEARPMTMEAMRLILNNMEKHGMLAGDAQLQTADGKILSWLKVVPDDDAPGGARVIFHTL